MWGTSHPAWPGKYVDRQGGVQSGGADTRTLWTTGLLSRIQPTLPSQVYAFKHLDASLFGMHAFGGGGGGVLGYALGPGCV